MSDYKVFAISLLLFILINYLFQMIKGGRNNKDMKCANNTCPYWTKDEDCPAAEGCAGYTDEIPCILEENKQYSVLTISEILD